MLVDSEFTTFGQLMPYISTLGQLIIVSRFSCSDRPNERINISESILVNNWLLVWTTYGCCRKSYQFYVG